MNFGKENVQEKKGFRVSERTQNETEVVVILLGIYDEEIEKQAIREDERIKADARLKNERAKERARTTIDMSLDFGYPSEKILITL